MEIWHKYLGLGTSVFTNETFISLGGTRKLLGSFSNEIWFNQIFYVIQSYSSNFFLQEWQIMTREKEDQNLLCIWKTLELLQIHIMMKFVNCCIPL